MTASRNIQAAARDQPAIMTSRRVRRTSHSPSMRGDCLSLRPIATKAQRSGISVTVRTSAAPRQETLALGAHRRRVARGSLEKGARRGYRVARLGILDRRRSGRIHKNASRRGRSACPRRDMGAKKHSATTRPTASWEGVMANPGMGRDQRQGLRGSAEVLSRVFNWKMTAPSRRWHLQLLEGTSRHRRRMGEGESHGASTSRSTPHRSLDKAVANGARVRCRTTITPDKTIAIFSTFLLPQGS